MAAAAVVFLGGATQRATAVPPGFTDTLVATVASPTALAFAPDGRLLVATQFGTLRVVVGDALQPEPALDLGPVVCTADEEGLLGVAVDPSFLSNGHVYLYYTRRKGGDCVNRVSRFTLVGSSIALASENVLVDEIPATGNHNAGDLRFGNDGYLYVSVGDGGCDWAGNSGCAGQNDAARDQHVLVGKILRITSTGEIPPTNPFQGPGTARCNVTGRTVAGNSCQETFAWGLRNPFRFAFDPNTTDTRFFINDVGQGVWEEVNVGQAGADYGWNVREGPCANGSTSNCGPPPAGMTNPAYAYSHAESGCAAITGGAFVPNGVWPGYDGAYLFGDYTCGKIFVLRPDGSGGYARTQFTDDVGAVVNMTFGPSPRGQALYYTNYASGGQVRRLESTSPGNRPPTARLSATPQSGAVPLAVSFDGSASSDPDSGDTLTYVWDFGDGTPAITTTSPTVSHTYLAAGTFTGVLVVRDDQGAASVAATVRLDPGNTAPEVSISSPSSSDRFAVGESILLSATATDAEDGELPASSLTWRVLRHHDTHTHPFLAPTTGTGLQIVQPAPEDLGSGIDGFLEIQLTATDSAGVTTTISRDVQPRKVALTFETAPPGLELILGGTASTAPTTLTSWQGHAVAAEARAQSGGASHWTFESWSDGGGAAHTIVTPSEPTSYTATFAPSTAVPGLVAAYGLDAGAGSSIVDSSGRGNGGTVSGATWTTAGRYGSALTFDGVNDWVTIADAASLDLTQALTIEAWVRPAALGGWRTVLAKERTGGVLYGLYADQGAGRPLGQVVVGGERNAVGTASVPVNAWTHLATTFDGAVVRLFVNGVQAGSTAAAGTMSASTGALRIGGNAAWAEWFSGVIDEVRVYDRALSAAELQLDMTVPVGATAPPVDTTPPTPPSGLVASVGVGAPSLGWLASTDDVAVVRYNVHRSQTPGFAVGAANRVGQTAATVFSDSALPAGTYYYRLTAEDAAANLSAPSVELAVVVPADEPPSVAITAPAAGATVTGTVTVSAAATDDNGVAGVQFRLGAVNLGAEDTLAPYAVSWNTATVANGTYVLGAVARDTAGRLATAEPVTVTVANAAPPPATGLVAAYAFDSASGATAADASGLGNVGTVSGAAWSAAGRYGSALTFDGVNDWVTIADAASLDLTNGMTLEAWVRPAASGNWRTVAIKERPGGMVYALYADQGGGRPLGQVSVGTERNAVGTTPVPLNAWTHLATTYDGAAVRLYVNGTLVSTTAIVGAMTPSTGALRIGGNGVWGEWFAGLIDEVRVYNRALAAAEIQQDLLTPVGLAPPADTSPPSTPTGLTLTTAPGRAELGWIPSTDEVGVVRYNVHRSSSAGFAPSAANRVGQPVAPGFVDSGLAAATYYYRVVAEDAAGNLSGASAAIAAVVPADAAPTISVTSPTSGATVGGTIAVTAVAGDDVGVLGVRFALDGVAIGAEDTSAPFSVSWDTRTVANGGHLVTATARDTAGQTTTSAGVPVTVANAAPPPSTGLVAAYGFNAGAGSVAADVSGLGNAGTLSGPAWSAAGRYGSALSFDGVNDWVTVPDAAALDLTTGLTLEAWVRPSRLASWRTVLFKERTGGMVYSLFASQGGSLPVGQVDLGGERSAAGATALPVNAWSHLAVTYDGTMLRLFVNGLVAGSTLAPGSLGASTGALRIGGNSVWSEWFAGLIDEVRVYSRALSPTEIQQDMQSPVG